MTEAPEHERFSDQEREALAGSDFAVCVATFYEDIAERLLNGAAVVAMRMALLKAQL